MARDIRELFNNEDHLTKDELPKGHEQRFLGKLDKAFPESRKATFQWVPIAASIVILLSIGIGVHTYFKPKANNVVVSNNPEAIKTLGDVSPGLKKVEDYYLASINLELSKMTYTAENKDLFDGYLEQLQVLNKEYESLSVELTKSGPNELTVNALIDNLKYRLNLLYRLRTQLNELNASNTTMEENSKSI